jgi:hypothetical protein
MHYLIAGLAKSGTTRLFSQLQQALLRDGAAPATAFEPDTDEALQGILATPGVTLTKVLVGRVKAGNAPIAAFDRHVLIYRDPRDQFLSTLLYFFYDFQVQGNVEGYRRAYAALERKVAAPEAVGTMALYDEVAALAGRAPLGVFRRLHEVQNAYEAAFSPHRLRYEALLDGDALPALEAYLGLSLDNDDVEVPQSYARVARSRGYGEWRNWFNADDLAFADAQWGAHIAALGYERTTVPAGLAIDPASSLGYVRQFDPSGPASA